MNNREAIRAVIPNKAAAMKVGAIIARFPDIKDQAVREAIGQMYRDGVLSRTGNKSDGFSYFLARPVKLKRYATAEARKAGKVATDAAHNRRRRGQTIEQRKAGWEDSREQRQAAREAARIQREQAKADKRASERKAQEQATAGKRRAHAIKRRQRSCTPAQRLLSNSPTRSHLPSITQAPRPAQRVESVAEWMMRTGQRPQVLPVAWERMAA